MKENNLKELIKFRYEKHDKIKKSGYSTYAYNFNKSHSIYELINNSDKYSNEKVLTAGRIVSFRKMGKASFVHIQGERSKIQLYLKNDLLPINIYDDIVRNLDLGDIIGCSGCLFTTKMGELSIKVDELCLLSKSLRPLPNLKEKDGESFNAFEDKELRYRNRQLDLIVNPEVKNIFIKRAQIISLIRRFLDDNKYLEVETPILQPVYGGASARPFVTYHNTLDQNLYLRIADELYLKRLIIGGFERVYELSKDFRNEGMDRSHNPEFTMLEFYKAYSDVYDMMDFTESLIKFLINNMSLKKINISNNTIDMSKKFIRKPMYELLNEYSGEDIPEMTNKDLFKFAKKESISLDDNLNRGQIIEKIFSELVEPKLISPTFVTDYPKLISPLAKENRNKNKDLVERFELFIGGMEYANAFSELNDPIEQRRRFEEQASLRNQGDEEAHMLDENFLNAMEVGLPPTGGVGIGIDRLVMLLTEQSSIKDVILFPAMRSE